MSDELRPSGAPGAAGRAADSPPPAAGGASSRAAAVFLGLGSVSAFFGVAAGALGAHGLRDRLTPALLKAFETGTHYQMIHALALVAVAILLDRRPSRAAIAAGWLFVAGTVLFSGSLYALAQTGNPALGAITPVGGLCFMAGWIALALSSVSFRDA